MEMALFVGGNSLKDSQRLEYWQHSLNPPELEHQYRTFIDCRNTRNPSLFIRRQGESRVNHTLRTAAQAVEQAKSYSWSGSGQVEICDLQDGV
jgi:hypothetical protein